jgi:phosphoribosylanthranilate isomerase
LTTRVKISGLTRLGDVELAIEMGAWALGFAVAGEAQRPGARAATEAASEPPLLSAGQAVELVAAAQARDAAVLAVVRVPGADPFETVRLAAAAGAKAIEIGAETDVAAVRAAMRAGGLAAAALIAARDSPGADEADFVVFPRGRADAPAATQAGWDPVTRPAFKRVIVAGEIGVGDVGEIVRRVHPFAIDLGRSLQARQGVLDAVGLRALLAALAAVDAEETW